jgi:hypothetical protein
MTTGWPTEGSGPESGLLYGSAIEVDGDAVEMDDGLGEGRGVSVGDGLGAGGKGVAAAVSRPPTVAADGPSVSRRQVGAGTGVGAPDGDESTAAEHADVRPIARMNPKAARPPPIR